MAWGTRTWPEKCLVCILTGNESSLAVETRGGWALCRVHVAAWESDDRIVNVAEERARGW